MSPKKTIKENYIAETFGNRVRLRVCGLLFRDDKLLLVKHKMDDYDLWAPPGGGVEFNESIEECLEREFYEETGLTVMVKEFLFLSEHIKPPLHAVELFYHVVAKDFSLTPGREPEIKGRNILQEFRFIDHKDLLEIPREELHFALKSCTNPIQLLDKSGHLK